jgi:serine acetyltransferase
MPPLHRRLLADVLFYHRLTRAGQAPTPVSLAATVLSNRGLWLLALQRIAYFNSYQCRRFRPAWWLTKPIRPLSRVFARVVGKTDFWCALRFDGAVYVSNKGYLMFGAESVGDESIIHDHCTFGVAGTDPGSGVPTIGNKVWIGPGCVFMGALKIGDGATILPGSILNFNVPPRCVVKGNPAMITHHDFDNARIRASTLVVDEISAD